MLQKTFAFLFFAVQLFSALAQKEEIACVSELAKAKAMTKILCSEQFFGRGYVKSGDSLAAVYLAKEFEARGLKNFNHSYFQPFAFDVNTFPGKMSVKIDGKALIPAIDFMVDPNSGSSKSVWNYKNLTSDEIFNKDIFQQFVSSLRKAHDFNSILLDIRGLTGDSLKKVRSIAEDFTGLCDILVVTDEKFTFSVGHDPMKHALIYVHGSAFQSGKSIATDIENLFIERHIANNVIALLPAAKKSRKRPTIVFSAHYDHLGGMGSETYFPGGNDNASGTAMLFTLADHFQQHPIPYNIVFMAFAGEEAGLIGSHYFTENPLFSLKKIKFLLNLDIMGSGEEGITVVNGTIFPKEFDALVDLNDQQQLLKQIKVRGKAANSDHYFFTEKGVPAFFIYTMGENKNYHDVQDTFEALSFSEYMDITKLISAFVRNL